MEVHAHTHTARKKWTHYFWEFLMLFLAVFCGFLAEYQLEHKIEKDREKQFIKMLFQDVKFDIASLSDINEARNKKALMLDSFAILLSSDEINKHGSGLYYMARYAIRLIDIRF